MTDWDHNIEMCYNWDRIIVQIRVVIWEVLIYRMYNRIYKGRNYIYTYNIIDSKWLRILGLKSIANDFR